VELHREGSVPAACTAGLFSDLSSVSFYKLEHQLKQKKLDIFVTRVILKIHPTNMSFKNQIIAFLNVHIFNCSVVGNRKCSAFFFAVC
jgi:hypothetical protein